MKTLTPSRGGRRKHAPRPAGPRLTRGDTLAFIAAIDRSHTLRLLKDGRLALLFDRRDRTGLDAPVTVVAETEATRRRAIQLALQVKRDPRQLSKGFLGSVQRKLGATELETLDKLATHCGLS